MIEEFKKFIMRGNVVDMAVGIVIGAAFGTIIKSLVADVIMPPIGLMLGGVDFSNIFTVIQEGATVGPYATLAAAQDAGAVTINWGNRAVRKTIALGLLTATPNAWKKVR